jgi:hypothetical protein
MHEPRLRKVVKGMTQSAARMISNEERTQEGTYMQLMCMVRAAPDSP